MDDDLGIQPAHARLDLSSKLPRELYKLQKIDSGRTEVIFLRENDRIHFSKISINLTLKYEPAEVQVNSSVPADAEIPESADLRTSSETPKIEAPDHLTETEDEDLDKTIAGTASNFLPSGTTPAPSMSRTEIVQETPAANRIRPLNEFSAVEKPEESSDAVANTPPVEDVSAAEIYSTAPIKQNGNAPATDANRGALTVVTEVAEDIKSPSKSAESPSQIANGVSSSQNKKPPKSSHTDEDDEAFESLPKPTDVDPGGSKLYVSKKTYSGRKRGRPKRIPLLQDSDDSDAEHTPTRSSKRSKKEEEEDDTQDSIKSSINVAASATKSTTSRSKGLIGTDVQNKTPSKRSRASPIDSDELYTGPKPVVAFSNSKIPDMPELMKFLRSHGGTMVEHVQEGECNMLVVRDGLLRKSIKLLLCVALGIPIVTEVWLIESAKQGRFLSIDNYIPRAPTQETEWGFSLRATWSVPQPDVLRDKIIYFTPALKKNYANFSEVNQLCKAVGAVRTMSKQARDVDDDEDVICLGLDEKDADCLTLLDSGRTCFSRDFLTTNILRGGTANFESDEFKIKAESSQKKEPKKRGRPRKS